MFIPIGHVALLWPNLKIDLPLFPEEHEVTKSGHARDRAETYPRTRAQVPLAYGLRDHRFHHPVVPDAIVEVEAEIGSVVAKAVRSRASNAGVDFLRGEFGPFLFLVGIGNYSEHFPPSSTAENDPIRAPRVAEAEVHGNEATGLALLQGTREPVLAFGPRPASRPRFDPGIRLYRIYDPSAVLVRGGFNNAEVTTLCLCPCPRPIYRNVPFEHPYLQRSGLM